MPAQYVGFFTVSVQASATLLGLLFVALTVDVSHTDLHIWQYSLSRSAFIAFAGILLISLLAISSTAQVIGGAGVILAFLGGGDLLFVRRKQVRSTREAWFITVSSLVYFLLLASSVWIWSGSRLAWHGLEAEFVILFGLALLATWRSLVIAKAI